MSEKRYCEDCKWFRRGWLFFYDKSMAMCANPETAWPKSEEGYERFVAREFDRPKKVRRLCSTARVSPCGEGAKYWGGK